MPSRIVLRPIGIAVGVVCSALVLGSCGDDGAAPPPEAAAVVPVEGDGQQAEAGATLPTQLLARATDARGRPVAGQPVTWTVASGGGSLANTSTETDADGLARATWTLGSVAGQQTVSVTVGSAPAATFTATALVGPAQSLEIVPAALELDAIGATQALAVSAADAYGNAITGRPVTWLSLDEAVAVVSAAGVVQAVGNGATKVRATMDGVAAEADVVVAQVAALVEVEPAAPVLAALGETVQLTATALDANGHPVEGLTFEWSSSDPDVVTVDATGLIEAVSNGTAQVEAAVTGGGPAGTANVTVQQAAASVVVTPGTARLTAFGETVQLHAVALDGNGNPLEVTAFAWTSSADAVASVDATGLVTAHGNGTATITASLGSVSGEAEVEVEQEAASVVVTPAAATLTPQNTTVQLSAVVEDAQGNVIASPTIVWSSSDIGIATVSASGLVSAVASGSATVTATSGGAGGSAAITVNLTQAPVARPDADTTTAGTPASRTAPGLLANDDLGDPAGTLASFGGGDLGVPVTQFTPGTQVFVGAGGTLQVNADGSYTFTAPTNHTGDFQFQYRLTNADGTSDGTVTVTVNAPPTANDDVHAGGSAPGDAFHTALNAPLTAPSGNTPSLLANDDAGYPAATIASFGGGSLPGDAGTHAAGSNAAGTGGSITVNADGAFTFTPDPTFTGTFTFSYRLTSEIGSDDAVATIAVGARPVAVADDYQAATGHVLVGNVPINTATGTPFSVLDNDSGDQVTLALEGTPANGQVTLNADGTFTLTPNAGFRNGNVTFQYRVQNGFGQSAPATVTVPVGAAAIWFVDNAQGSNGDGRQASPFNCLVGAGCFSAAANDAAGDVIFLHTGSAAYTGGLTLLNDQLLIGAGATASLAAASGLTIPAHSTLPATGGTRPSVTTTAPGTDAVSLGQNNTLRGFDIGSTVGAGISGSGFGTLTVSEMNVGGSGQALDLASGTLAATFGTLATTGTGAGVPGIELTGVAGTMTATATTLAATDGTALRLANNTANLTFGTTTLTPAAGQRGLHATGNTGTLAMSGGTVTTSGAVAIEVVGPSAAQRTPISLKMEAVNANGGVTGVVLTNTSATGFRTDGLGTPGSGGTIQSTTGPGISLTNVQNITLQNMVIENTGASGIKGTGVEVFALLNSTVSNTGTTNEDANIDFFANTAPGTEVNVSGTVTITGNTLSTDHATNIDIQNYGGVLTDAEISDNVLTNNSSIGGGGIRLIALGGPANVAEIWKATIDNNQINGTMSNAGLRVQCGQVSLASPPAVCGRAGSATDVIAITNNTISGVDAANRIGVEGLVTLVDGVGQGNFTIADNEVSHTTGTAISHSAFGNTNVTARITGNTIVANNELGSQGIGVGTSATTGFAINAPTLAVTISNNNVSHTDGNGILVVARDASATLNVKIQDNTVAAPLAGARPGIRVDSGNANSTNETVCLNISGNTSAGSGAALGIGLRKQGTDPAVNAFRIHGMTATATPGVEAYVNGLNPNANGTFLISATSGFGNCNLP